MKFSPDAKLLAYCDSAKSEVIICDFDNATGLLTYRNKISDVTAVYGLEFSPDSQLLYYTSEAYWTRYQATIGSSDVSNSTSLLIHDGQQQPNTAHFGALQLGPDNEIYIMKHSDQTIAVIRNPNTVGAGCNYQHSAVDASGATVQLVAEGYYGLPNFTRISDHCRFDHETDDQCDLIAHDVNAQLSHQAMEHSNHLKRCDGQDPSKPAIETCKPLDLPDIRPQISITWGNSNCDCVESDDMEVMMLTICNPYSNQSFDHFTIHRLTILDDQGNAVPNIPNGQPSVQLVPVGPYCFGEIAPCSCVSREFVIRNRGAVSGRYRIEIEGVCFDAQLHFDQKACFTFDICKD